MLRIALNTEPLFRHNCLFTHLLKTEISTITVSCSLSLCHLQPVVFPAGVKMEQLSLHPNGRHCLALSRGGEVFSWGAGDNGRLGLGDTRCIAFSPHKSKDL